MSAQRTSLLLAAHGDRGGEKGNRWLLDHARALRGQGRFLCVEAGVLKGEPSLEDALDAAAAGGGDRVLVYPVCMSNGYFVETVLAGRVARAGCPLTVTILPPLGLNPRLPSLFLDRALGAAQALDAGTRAARLLVVGHGSKLGPASAAATRRMVSALAATGRFAAVEPAFLEETPFLQDALALDESPTVVGGFFSGEGMHAGGDVPAAIAEAGANAAYTGAIGVDRRIPDLIRSAAVQALVSAR